MKRKLDEDGVPTPVREDGAKGDTQKSFQSLGLDSRLLQAIAQEGFSKPTPVQAQAIPAALEGKDILARSKTGSGKTLAYVLPVLESILRKKKDNERAGGTAALILLPTRELAGQVAKVVARYTALCGKDVRSLNLADSSSDSVQRALLADRPDVVVATPGRAHVHLRSGALRLAALAHLVIDEADLVLSYGYEDDLRGLSAAFPERPQVFLMSATLATEVEALKGMFCKDPLVLTLDDGEAENPISQYAVKCAEDEKFLLIYVIVKLNLIKGKCIVFVGDIDRCYRLKLFLEQFGARSCVLNSELPVNSRIHVVEEFNKNIYNIIIASDEHEVLGPVSSHRKKSAAAAEPADSPAANDQGAQQPSDGARPKKAKSSKKKSKEYGISRGIDFQHVACVLNFDLPPSAPSYTHRIGRTGRAGRAGMALSFVVPRALYRAHPPTSFRGAERDEEVLADIVAQQAKKDRAVEDYHFDMAQVDAFRYRMNDALRAVTGTAVREARTRELRQELIRSEKLQKHFEDNPEDLHHLRHDGELRAARTQPHLKHVPEYLLPNRGDKTAGEKGLGFVGFQKTAENRIRKQRALNRTKGKGGKGGRKRANPLKTFSAKGRFKKR